MDFQMKRMESKDKRAVMEMMRVFYSSDAVITNGSERIFENDVDACVGDSPYAEGYVFNKEEEYLGYAMLSKSYSTEFGKPCIWVEDLYINPSCRGCGIGNAFFKLLFSTYGDVIYRLEVEAENAPAISLYEKYGFKGVPYIEMIKRSE